MNPFVKVFRRGAQNLLRGGKLRLLFLPRVQKQQTARRDRRTGDKHQHPDKPPVGFLFFLPHGSRTAPAGGVEDALRSVCAGCALRPVRKHRIRFARSSRRAGGLPRRVAARVDLQLVAVRVDERRVLRLVGDRFQLLPKLLGAGIAVLRVKRAGLQDDLAEAAFAVKWTRQRFAGNAPAKRLLAAAERDRLRRLREERAAILVQHPVQHQSERICINAEAIFPTGVDLRRHIAVRSLFGQARGRPLDRARDTEITELIIPVVGNKNVFRLDVAVDDIVPLAQLQRLADIDTELDDVAPRHRVLVDIRQQRVQQLHADENVPADAVGVPKDGVILIADNIAGAFEARHDGALAADVLHDAVKILLCLRRRHALVQHALQLRPALRHGNDLQRSFVNAAEVLPLDLIDRPIAPLPQLPADLPFVKHNGAALICRHSLFLLYRCSVSVVFYPFPHIIQFPII